jgi:hypothetical protein
MSDATEKRVEGCVNDGHSESFCRSKYGKKSQPPLWAPRVSMSWLPKPTGSKAADSKAAGYNDILNAIIKAAHNGRP